MKRIKLTANVTKNAQAKRDIDHIIYAIKEGKLDHILSLTTFQDGLVDGKLVKRPKTMSEIDQSILDSRNHVMQSMLFAKEQVSLFSTYLKNKVGDSVKLGGYDHDTILRNITEDEFLKLILGVMYKLDIDVSDDLFKKIKTAHHSMSEQAMLLCQ